MLREVAGFLATKQGTEFIYTGQYGGANVKKRKKKKQQAMKKEQNLNWQQKVFSVKFCLLENFLEVVLKNPTEIRVFKSQ